MVSFLQAEMLDISADLPMCGYNIGKQSVKIQ